MKPITQVKWIIALFFVSICTQSLFAQATKADIFDQSKQITWLGVDYSQAKFIGAATQWENAGKIDNAQIRDIYVPAWNQIFINEQKKYNVADALHRSSVNYDIDVTIKANNKLTEKDFFTNNPSDFKKLTDADIANVVKGYDFGKNTGVGLMFIAEGMSKGEGEMGLWVTFVDMKTKTVLLDYYQTEKPGGFGFRNYWAKPLYTALKDIKKKYNSLK